MARFLIILSLHDASKQRLEVTIPAIKSILEKCSDKGIEAAFRSANGDTFGFCLISDRTAIQILRAIVTATYHDGYLKNAPIIDGRDNVIIFEVGGCCRERIHQAENLVQEA